MTFTIPDFSPALPEIFLATMACVVLVVDVYVTERYRQLTYQLSQAALVGAAVLSVAVFPAEAGQTLSGHFAHDAMGSFLKIVTLVVSCYAFFYSRLYLAERDLLRGEYFVLGLFAVLGIMVLISAGTMLTLYLGLELMSLCLYAMVALNRRSVTAAEAAMKYFVLGALASGMLLYGISLIYGVTGTLDLRTIGAYVADGDALEVVMVLGLVFTLVGVAFKLGAAPFHMWVPDVYEGAPTSVTLFVGTAPKLAAFAMLMRLLVDGLAQYRADWSDMLVLLAILSMGIGNIVAIAQTNIKRMLGYSTVSHVGFLFLGIIAGSPSGYAASMFYIVVYSVMALAAFGMVVVLGRSDHESDQLLDFKGLNDRSPWLAFLTMIIMLSMAGVPPFVGFWAKWAVLREVVAADLAWLAVVAVIFAVIGLFYYLRVVRLVYFDKPDDAGETLAVANDARLVISSNALVILALGIFPGALMAYCLSAFGL